MVELAHVSIGFITYMPLRQVRRQQVFSTSLP